MDFFSNIIKTTINKVESYRNVEDNIDENKEEANQRDNNKEVVKNERKKISPDGALLSGDNDDDNEESEKDKKERIRRLSSGDTSGPDDNVNETIDEDDKKDTKDKDSTRKSSTSEELSHKAIESAKYFGNFLYNVANKAGQTMTATAKQIKQTVEQTGIISDFTKEQQEFIKEHGGKTEVGEPPWVGCDDEDNVKEQILSLSQDKRNFVRSPPSGVQFQFDMDTMYPIALVLLKEDPNLNKMRYEIVPKLVNEESFWRNYFYRVSIIKQSQLSSFTKVSNSGNWSSRSSSAEGPDDPGEISPTGEQPEFISESFQGNDNVSEEDLRKGLKELGMNGDKDKLDIDEELSKDLQEFEVVAGDAEYNYAEIEKELES